MRAMAFALALHRRGGYTARVDNDARRFRPALQLNIDANWVSQAFTGSGYIQSIITSKVNAFVQRSATRNLV